MDRDVSARRKEKVPQRVEGCSDRTAAREALLGILREHPPDQGRERSAGTPRQQLLDRTRVLERGSGPAPRRCVVRGEGRPAGEAPS